MYAAGGVGDHFVFVGGSTPGPLPVIKGFMHHFAQPLAVPQWAFGWHQCRWGYNSTTKLREVVDRFAEEELPLDAIWNDIDYMKDYRSFSYDSEGEFADLPQFIQEIHNNSLHYVPIIDAGIAVR
jgi:alpha-glucosidase (family GH31 glycosyl hydrolase)